MNYLSYYVLEERPSLIQEPDYSLVNRYVLVGTELQKQYKNSLVPTEWMAKYIYRQESQSERWTWKTRFESLMGKYGMLWVPSWKADYRLTTYIPAAGGQMRVVSAYRTSAQRGYYRHLYFPKNNHCALITAVAVDKGEEVITFSPGVPSQINSVDEIVNLYFCRLDQDAMRVEMESDGGNASTIAMTFKELQKETPIA